jgi:hypothetical protein
MKVITLVGFISLMAGLSVKAQNTDWTTTATSIGLGTTDPQSKLHVKNGDIMVTDPSFNNINARLTVVNLPSLRFTRWTGNASQQDNTVIGQFFNTPLQEYSLGIGMGRSITGDQNFTNRLMTVTVSGNVGIGTETPQSKLAVNGNVYCKEVKVTVEGWPDYVFQPGYSLRPLSEVARYIDQHHHLPEVPSAEEVAKNGVHLGDNQATLLKKIEELTLYVIDLKKMNDQIKEENTELKKRVEKLEIKN